MKGYPKVNESEYKKSTRVLPGDIEQELKDFEPYTNDPFFMFVFGLKNRYSIPYPFNCFILSLILLPIYVLPFYLEGGLGYLYDPAPASEGGVIGAFQSTTAMLLIAVIPAGFMMIDRIFRQYVYTFREMRVRAKVTNEDYQKFIDISNWSLQSPNATYFKIGFAIVAILFTTRLYLNPTDADLIDNIGIPGFVIFLIISVVTWIIIISICWYLYSIVRTIRRFCSMPLDVRPLDPDGAAGLKPLADLSFRTAIVSLLGVITILYSLFFGKRTIDEPFMFSVLMLLIFSMCVLFLFPLTNAHDTMMKAKIEILGVLSEQHDIAYKKIRDGIPNDEPCVTEARLTELRGLDILYNKAASMPVWPFDFHILGQFSVTILVPLVLIMIDAAFF